MEELAAYTCVEQKDFASHPLLMRLLELHDIPKKLYIKGILPHVTLDEYGRATPRILTIVGSRKHTSYGRHALEMLISSLEGQDVIILSGLALGIDGLAHTAALKHNLRTIAVPGSGLSSKVLYPSTHKHLAKDIVAYDGALISELEPDTPASPWTFPQRNRVMAALSDAVLIIEAEEKSGTLITARQALELGRDIGAVPGEIFSPTASGTNMLIHEGAYPIAKQEDILSLLHLSVQETEDAVAQKKNTSNLHEHETLLLELLREPQDKDTLLQKSNLQFSDFITAFSSLEMSGYIEETFGEVRRIV